MTHRDRVRHRGDCRDFALPDLGGDRTEEPCLQLAATFAIPGASLGHDAHLHNPRLRRSTVPDAPHPFDRPALGAHGTAALWTRRTFPSTHFRAVVRPLLITLSGLGPPSAIALPSVDLFFPHVLGRRACLRDRARVCVRARAARVPACVCVFARVLYIHIRLCRCLVRPACSTSERALHLASLVISRPFAWLACPPGLFACRGAVRSPRTAPFVAGGRKRLWYSEYRMHPTALEPLWLSRARWGA